eukprot:1732989-Rhodomonas_salina.1
MEQMTFGTTLVAALFSKLGLLPSRRSLLTPSFSHPTAAPLAHNHPPPHPPQHRQPLPPSSTHPSPPLPFSYPPLHLPLSPVLPSFHPLSQELQSRRRSHSARWTQLRTRLAAA